MDEWEVNPKELQLVAKIGEGCVNATLRGGQRSAAQRGAAQRVHRRRVTWAALLRACCRQRRVRRRVQGQVARQLRECGWWGTRWLPCAALAHWRAPMPRCVSS